MKKYLFRNIITLAAVLIFGISFIAKFGWPNILRSYIESGMGTCKQTPIFCKVPDAQVIEAKPNKEYLSQLAPYNFRRMTISLPDGFNVFQQKVQVHYYKKWGRGPNTPNIYMVSEKPGFFIKLFPDVKKHGITDNYLFVKRTLYAKISDIKNLGDAFFVIMKGIFIPDTGDQINTKMAEFSCEGKRFFINYNITEKENYFDCNIIDENDAYFKVYIKDRKSKLDLDKVLTILSTAQAKTQGNSLDFSPELR